MSRQQGSKAEATAMNTLLASGHKLITQNFTCRGGEIDLITFDGKFLVFSEVKARTNCHFGHPAEFVDKRKQQKIIYSAKNFLHRHPVWHTYPMRFDVICVFLENDTIEIIENAFTL